MGSWQQIVLSISIVIHGCVWCETSRECRMRGFFVWNILIKSFVLFRYIDWHSQLWRPSSMGIHCSNVHLDSVVKHHNMNIWFRLSVLARTLSKFRYKWKWFYEAFTRHAMAIVHVTFYPTCVRILWAICNNVSEWLEDKLKGNVVVLNCSRWKNIKWLLKIGKREK